MAEVKGKYVIFKEGDYFVKYRLKASNGQALVLSEPYRNEKSCREGIDTLKKNAADCRVDYERDKHKLWCFRLITKQGRALAQSANYESERAAKSAYESFKKFYLTDLIVFDEEESKHFKVEIFNEKIEEKAKGKFMIVKDEDEDYSYLLKASNGQILCTSQSYRSKDNCREALDRFKEFVYTGDFYIFIDKRGNAFFKLYSKQLRLVMTGEVYATKAAAISAIKSIKGFTKQASIVDEK